MNEGFPIYHRQEGIPFLIIHMQSSVVWGFHATKVQLSEGKIKTFH